MPKRLLFVTTHNFASNPRLVKEVRTSLSLGHKVTVLSFAFQNWSSQLNELYIKEFDRKACLIIIQGGRNNKIAWLTSTLTSMVSGFLLPVVPRNIYLLSFYVFKRSLLLYLALKKHRAKYDFVIAHNPGSFVPAMYFAERIKAKMGIDIEDYHPGESNDAVEIHRLETIMREVLAKAEVVTAASPHISEQSRHLLSRVIKFHTVIKNVFSLKYQPVFKILPNKPLRLIWFSQTVGLNRGIQDVILAMSKVKSFTIQLTIVGNCHIGVQNELAALLKSNQHQIEFLPPMAENYLFEQCSCHHIGLALEPGFSLNNRLALSNKLFTYLLAGNAVISTETVAQKQFIAENPGIGKSYPIGRFELLARILYQYALAPEELEKARSTAYQLARSTFNWETESKKFIEAYELT